VIPPGAFDVILSHTANELTGGMLKRWELEEKVIEEKVIAMSSYTT
jgi:hypothetical protein